MQRPRRLRKNPVVREMIAETRLSKDMFIYPYFVVPGSGVIKAIDAMPGINHFSTDNLMQTGRDFCKTLLLFNAIQTPQNLATNLLTQIMSLLDYAKS